MRYAGYIGKHLPTEGQWRYLEELYYNHGEFGGCGFNRTLYGNLDMAGSECSLEDYKRFLALKNELSYVWRFKLPKPYEVRDVVETLTKLDEYRGGKEQVDVLVQARKKNANYEYFGDEYEVILPETPFEICIEEIGRYNRFMVGLISCHKRKFLSSFQSMVEKLWLIYDPYKLIVDSINEMEDDDCDKNLWEYAEKFRTSLMQLPLMTFEVKRSTDS